MSRTLCIAGMHRSGTSLVTSWLQRCGLQVDDGQLLGAKAGNVRGHFEDTEFTAIQQEALLDADPASNGWRVYADAFATFSPDQRLRARLLARRRDAKYPRWGWKDPRSTLFLTEWKALVPDLKVLLLWRPCAEVVASLVRRAVVAGEDFVAITPFDAAQLWLRYNARVLDFKRLFPDDALLVPIDAVLTQPSTVLGLLNDRLQLGLAAVPLGEVFERELLDRGADLRARVVSASPSVADLEDALHARSDVREDRRPAHAMHPLRQVLVDDEALYAYLLDQERTIDGLQGELAALRQRVADVRPASAPEVASPPAADVLASYVSALAERDRRLAEVEATAADWLARLTASEAQLVEASAALAVRERQVADLRAVVARVRSHPAYRAYRAVKDLVSPRARRHGD